MGSPLDSKTSLEFLGTILSIDVATLLRSSVVRTMVDAFFHHNREEFVTNPANTLLYQSLRALEERAVVHIAETLKDEHGVFSIPAGLRRTVDLTFHRHALSHPRTIRWRLRGMQAFFDAKRHWTDNRPAIIWDLQRSLNEELAKHGAVPAVTSIQVTGEMAILASALLRCSVKPESSERIPSEQLLLAKLTQTRDEWIQILERIRPEPTSP